MTCNIGIGAKGGVLGFKEEATWGTKVSSFTKFIRLIADSLKVGDNPIHSGTIPGIYTDEDEYALGRIRVSGNFGTELRYEGAELLFKHAMGTNDKVTITTGSNDALDFDIGGAELNATIAAGTYVRGLSQADSGSLCKAIYDAIVAVEAAGTYTVTYSTNTRKFTITRSAGILNLLWNTGTNTATNIGKTIGFSDNADDTGSLSYTGDVGFTPATEVATFIVTSANKYLDFNIGAAELNATIAEGTYAAGINQNSSGSLCEAIHTAIGAAEGAGTYDVEFDIGTKKFTIKRSAGTFEILWKTGTHGSDNTNDNCGTLLGYTTSADDTGALSYTADSAVVAVYDHTFTLTDCLPTGLTLAADRDKKAFVVAGGKLNTMALQMDPNGFLKATFGVLGKDMTAEDVESETLPTAPLIVFHHGTVTFDGGSMQTKNFGLSLDNKLKGDLDNIGTRYIDEPTRTGKIDVTGNLLIDFEDETEYDIFRAGTAKALSVVYQSVSAIKGTTYYKMTISVPQLRLTDGVPMITGPGPMTVALPFKAYATDSTTREFTITMRNTLCDID